MIMEYYNRLKELRTDRDLFQKDIAEILDIDQQYYSRYEQGKNELPIRHLKTLCLFYGVSSDYILQNLDRIKHTTIKAEIVDTLPDTAVSTPESKEMIISSLRLDVMISAVYKLSRKETSQLIVQGKAFVNSCQTVNGSYTVKEGDIISLRGFGRFQFAEQLRTTKKDRLVAEMIIYK